MKHTISSITLLAFASAVMFTSEAGAAGTQQNVSVRGSVINQARNGAKSEMDIGSVTQKSGRITGNQQTTVHIKGSVINEASGRKKNSTVSIGSR